MKKRLLALITCLCMVVTSVPVAAFADGEEITDNTEIIENTDETAAETEEAENEIIEETEAHDDLEAEEEILPEVEEEIPAVKLEAAVMTTAEVQAEEEANAASYYVFDAETGTITDLTAEGKKQAVHVIPEEIDGKPVLKISSKAFSGNSKITSLTFPASLAEIELYSGRFELAYGCSNLTEINVDEGNEVYKSVDGILYTKDGTKLLKAPEGKDLSQFTIPSDVTILGNSCFRNHKKMPETIVIHEGVTDIETRAFNDSGLDTVKVPHSVEKIGQYAFSNASGVPKVLIYNGTSAEWKNLNNSIGIYGGTKVICTKDVWIVSLFMNDGSKEAYKTITTTAGKLSEELPTPTREEYEFEGWFDDDRNGFGKQLTNDTLISKDMKVYAHWKDLCDVVVDANGTVTGLTDLGKTKSEIVIPESQRGQAITGISATGLSRYNKLTKVTIPASVTNINRRFVEKSPNLTEIIVDSENANYASENGALLNKEKTTLIKVPEGRTEFTIPETVKVLGEYSFENSKISSIILPEGLEEIGDYVFKNSEKLSGEINIPSKVKNIMSSEYQPGKKSCSFLDGCKNVTAINVAPENIVYYSKEGILYQGTNLLLCPLAKAKTEKLFIKYGTTYIEQFAFQGCRNIKELVIPKTVKEVGRFAFQGAYMEGGIYVPKSVKTVGDDAFRQSIDPTNGYIYYEGSEKEWDRLNVTLANNYKGRVLFNQVMPTEEKPTEYTITFDANGGTVDPATATTENGKLTSLPEATRENHTFDGWFTMAEGGDKVDTSKVYEADTTLYAHWTEVKPEPEVKEATITFKVVNGTWEDDTTADKTVKVKLTDGKGTLADSDIPTGMKANEGYENGAWDTNPNKEVIGDAAYTYTFTKKEEVKPEPEVKEATITFDAQGGTAVSSAKTVNKRLADLPSTTKSGYTFEGWFTSAQGGTKVTTSKVYEADTTLYAHWREDVKHPITIKPVEGENGKVEVNISSAKRGTKITIKIDPKKGFRIESITITRSKNPVERLLSVFSSDEIIPVTKVEGEENLYEFEMPDYPVDIDVTFTEDTNNPDPERPDPERPRPRPDHGHHNDKDEDIKKPVIVKPSVIIPPAMNPPTGADL